MASGHIACPGRPLLSSAAIRLLLRAISQERRSELTERERRLRWPSLRPQVRVDDAAEIGRLLMAFGQSAARINRKSTMFWSGP